MAEIRTLWHQTDWVITEVATDGVALFWLAAKAGQRPFFEARIQDLWQLPRGEAQARRVGELQTDGGLSLHDGLPFVWGPERRSYLTIDAKRTAEPVVTFEERSEGSLRWVGDVLLHIHLCADDVWCAEGLTSGDSAWRRLIEIPSPTPPFEYLAADGEQLWYLNDDVHPAELHAVGLATGDEKAVAVAAQGITTWGIHHSGDALILEATEGVFTLGADGSLGLIRNLTSEEAFLAPLVGLREANYWIDPGLVDSDGERVLRPYSIIRSRGDTAQTEFTSASRLSKLLGFGHQLVFVQACAEEKVPLPYVPLDEVNQLVILDP